MAVTYKKIETATVTGTSSNSISFTNIPQTYRDLVIQASLRSDRAGFPRAPVTMTYNNIASGYYTKEVYGSNGNALQGASVTGSFMQVGNMTSINGTANVFTPITIYLLNYTNTGIQRVAWADCGQTNNTDTWIVQLLAPYLDAQDAITSITLRDSLQNSNFVINSTATLYGIKDS